MGSIVNGGASSITERLFACVITNISNVIRYYLIGIIVNGGDRVRISSI